MLQEQGPLVQPYPPLEHTDLSEQTYQVLKSRILTRLLQPGQRILVDEIAKALGVSRTPVTDALKRLAVEGLVDIQPRRGTFVSELTAQDVAELFAIRLLVELHAAKQVLEQGKVAQFLEEIQGPIEQMREATLNDSYVDYESFIDADRTLHATLVAMTCNERLMQIYSGLNVHMRVARAHYLNSVENARQAHQEHEAILQAFKSADPALVQEALAAHITHVKSRMLELLEARGGKL